MLRGLLGRAIKKATANKTYARNAFKKALAAKVAKKATQKAADKKAAARKDLKILQNDYN